VIIKENQLNESEKQLIQKIVLNYLDILLKDHSIKEVVSDLKDIGISLSINIGDDPEKTHSLRIHPDTFKNGITNEMLIFFSNTLQDKLKGLE